MSPSFTQATESEDLPKIIQIDYENTLYDTPENPKKSEYKNTASFNIEAGYADNPKERDAAIRFIIKRIKESKKNIPNLRLEFVVISNELNKETFSIDELKNDDLRNMAEEIVDRTPLIQSKGVSYPAFFSRKLKKDMNNSLNDEWKNKATSFRFAFITGGTVTTSIANNFPEIVNNTAQIVITNAMAWPGFIAHATTLALTSASFTVFRSMTSNFQNRSEPLARFLNISKEHRLRSLVEFLERGARWYIMQLPFISLAIILGMTCDVYPSIQEMVELNLSSTQIEIQALIKKIFTFTGIQTFVQGTWVILVNKYFSDRNALIKKRYSVNLNDLEKNETRNGKYHDSALIAVSVASVTLMSLNAGVASPELGRTLYTATGSLGLVSLLSYLVYQKLNELLQKRTPLKVTTQKEATKIIPQVENSQTKPSLLKKSTTALKRCFTLFRKI